LWTEDLLFNIENMTTFSALNFSLEDHPMHMAFSGSRILQNVRESILLRVGVVWTPITF